ncbi:MAG: hypothetical protein KC516_02040 [Nanoarchaeota archaeon]|nr:hypothetical protein [Nanoarchaeota archaeon]
MSIKKTLSDKEIRKFWKKVYVASVKSGGNSHIAKNVADLGVGMLKEEYFKKNFSVADEITSA